MEKKIKKEKKEEADLIAVTHRVYGDPEYVESDDIFTRGKRINLDEPTDNLSEGEGLDIPGAELDDADEITGDEDEENNYYSLGGDRHEDLEDDQA